ncbi:kinesin-like protein KIF27 isoform X2 [Oryzias latipes]|uniref:Kinesin family member 27 n=1 Tax=Oryzias latipes TaxID=8090 RepID=A0A3B3IN88_ORYLA|nr:kinesin-like protein KIF27 isoform X2 [Oryzias latipes]
MTEECVCVAVRVRPLLAREVLHRHQVCVRVVPGSAQVMLGSDRLFSFDHAFGPTASQDEVYESCVQPLVESCVQGSNATVFCYGQTGSGKTYTLGGGNQDDEGGIIDRVVQEVFRLLQEKKKNNEGLDTRVRVSYVELYMEELRDLLELQNIHKELHIREDERGNTVVVGVKELVVTSTEELLSFVEMGNALRHTGTTGMNEHSSRSHTVLTLHVNICRRGTSTPPINYSQTSKLCLVDLAGSERAGKTGNTGTRLKETAHINTGLLALGNVIRALTDSRSRRGSSCTSAYIPYRDAKITRLLRDSLGGTAHTLMVACVSPSHHYVAETLNVLQFASKARHIHNRPGAITPESKSCHTAWHPDEARLEELKYEVQTLRGLLEEKERDIKVEKQKTGEKDSFKESDQIQMPEPDKVSPEEGMTYYLLAQEAADILPKLSSVSSSLSFKQRLEDWQERFKAVSLPCQTDDGDRALRTKVDKAEEHHKNISKLRKELYKCKELLHTKEQLIQQKDAKQMEVQQKVEELLHENKAHQMALEEEKERSRIKTEQLVNQEILINQLRSNLMTHLRGVSGASAEEQSPACSGKRPHSVPPVRHSCLNGPPRKIHSSPPGYSLERVMAAFKMRGHLLLAEVEEKDEVYCPFLKKEEEEEEENGILTGRERVSHSLNKTWTSNLSKSALTEKSSIRAQTNDGDPDVQQPQATTDIVEGINKSNMRRARRAGATERRIHDLSVSMRMKEELIKELQKTQKGALALRRHGQHSGEGREVDVLARLSMQNQQVCSEMYHSLQHMRLQRAQLQSSLRELGKTADTNKEVQQNGLQEISWLEEEEERVLQKKAEMQELEEELKRREEVVQQRETCLQQKKSLETKMLRSSQGMSRDLLSVSLRLECVEEQLQSSGFMRESGGDTLEELVKERDMLKKKRDILDAQLRDNRVLPVEEEYSLLQLEEAIEALDAALEFKNKSIQSRQDQLSSLHPSQSSEPAQLCSVVGKLKKLSAPEAVELLILYFNKVVSLREAERHLRLRCEELELHAGEQEIALKQLEAGMQRLALDTDRRLTEQQKDHQNNLQELLQKLNGSHGEMPQATQDRLQFLEKELFFYKSSSRQLKKKLKELFVDGQAANTQPSSEEDHRKINLTQMQKNDFNPLNHLDMGQSGAQVGATYTKINSEQKDSGMHEDSDINRSAHQNEVYTKTQNPFSSPDCKDLTKPKITEHDQIPTGSKIRRARGKSDESSKLIPVRLHRRELRQICTPDQRLSGAATGGLQSVSSSKESMLEDSIEMLRKTHS